MYFGVDYYPEHWVFPLAGTAENPEAQWQWDAEHMVAAGFNVVRIGEFSWGICEPQAGKYDFLWLRRVMDIMAAHNIKVTIERSHSPGFTPRIETSAAFSPLC